MKSREQAWDVIVLGAGAAGMMCAFEAGRRGRRVLLLEHGDRVGRKILISGGGRCNFTNTGTRAENFLSDNPHFAKSALAGFTPRDMVALVEKHGIRYHEKTLGQLFCDESAVQIVRLLESECDEAKVEVRRNVTVLEVRSTHGVPASEFEPTFLVATSAGELRSKSVVVATGGLSIPKMGATGLGYDIARSFGHAIVTPRAGLVPLVFSAEDRERWCDLTGLAVDVVASVAKQTQVPFGNDKRGGRPPHFRERMLITHRGLSGPAVLQASSYWRPGEAVAFDLAPGQQVLHTMLASNGRRDEWTLAGELRAIWPLRFAERWAAQRTERGWSNAALERVEAEIHAWRVKPAGDEGFTKAEVTVGGVDTRELDARTMQSCRVPGLYFIGEVVDVTGWLGGYNFQWAWASAVAAAKDVGGNEG